MHHSTFTISTTYLAGHVDKALHLALEISIWDVSAVFAPLAREDAAFRCTLRQWWDRVPEQWKALSFIEPGAFATTCGESLLEERCVDDTNDRSAIYNEAN